MSSDPQQLTLAASQEFLAATRQFGSALQDDGQIALGWGGLFARPVVLQVQPQEGGMVLALGIEVTGESLVRPIRDISVGVAESADLAIKLALQGFLSGPYAVLLDALGEKAVPYRYGITQTNNATGESVEWAIFESVLQIGGAEEARDPLVAKLNEKPLFVRLAEGKAMPPLQAGRVHWLKVHAAREGDRPPFCECVFDSTPWPAGQELLSNFDWPDLKGPQTFRQYWVFTLN